MKRSPFILVGKINGSGITVWGTMGEHKPQGWHKEKKPCAGGLNLL